MSGRCVHKSGRQLCHCTRREPLHTSRRRRTFEQLQQILDPLLISMRIVHAPRDQYASDPLKLGHTGYPPALLRHDKHLVRLDAELGIVPLPRAHKVVVQDLAERSLLVVVVRVRLIRLEDHHLDHGRLCVIARSAVRFFLGVGFGRWHAGEVMR